MLDLNAPAGTPVWVKRQEPSYDHAYPGTTTTAPYLERGVWVVGVADLGGNEHVMYLSSVTLRT